MRIFSKGKDGGPESTSWGYWLIESKRWFSIALIKFNGPSREAYHTHAFNAVSWLLWGRLHESVMIEPSGAWIPRVYTPSLWPIVTPRERLHKVSSRGVSWALTFRGPWAETWEERIYHAKSDSYLKVTLANGRKVVDAR